MCVFVWCGVGWGSLADVPAVGVGKRALPHVLWLAFE